MPLWLGLEEDEFRTLTWSWQLGGREGYGLWWPESGEVIYHRVSRQTAASHYCYGHSTIISPSQPSIQQGRQFSHFICQKRCVLPSAADPICTFLDVPPNAVHLLNDFIKERTFSVESFVDHWGRRGFDSLLMWLLPETPGFEPDENCTFWWPRGDGIPLNFINPETRHIDIGYYVSGYAKIFYLLSYPIEHYE